MECFRGSAEQQQGEGNWQWHCCKGDGGNGSSGSGSPASNRAHWENEKGAPVGELSRPSSAHHSKSAFTPKNDSPRADVARRPRVGLWAWGELQRCGRQLTCIALTESHWHCSGDWRIAWYRGSVCTSFRREGIFGGCRLQERPRRGGRGGERNCSIGRTCRRLSSRRG